MQGIKGNHFMLGLEVGTAAAHDHHLVGVFPHDQEFSALGNLQRQDAVVLEKHHAIGRYPAGGGEMLRRGETAVMRLRSHGGTEDRAQDTARFVVQAFFRSAAVTKAFQIRTGQVIMAVAVRCGTPETVGPSAHLDVQPVGDGLVVIPAAAPVTDDDAVEAPFPFEDIAQKPFVMTVELAVVQIV